MYSSVVSKKTSTIIIYFYVGILMCLLFCYFHIRNIYHVLLQQLYVKTKWEPVVSNLSDVMGC